MRTLPVLILALALVEPACALPPGVAPPGTTIYRQSIVRTRDGGKRTFDDTVTITVDGKRSRWQRKSDGQTTVYDGVAGTITMWGGGLPDKEALRSPLPDPMSSWDLGSAGIAADAPPPAEQGTATIAGQPCTRLAYATKHFGNPELCVTPTGLVTKFHLDDPEDGSVTTFEAEKTTPGAPPAGTFDVPAGYGVQTMDRM